METKMLIKNELSPGVAEAIAAGTTVQVQNSTDVMAVLNAPKRTRKPRVLPAQPPAQPAKPARKPRQSKPKIAPRAKGSPERLSAGKKAAETRRLNLLARGIVPKVKTPTAPVDRRVAALKAWRTMVQRKIKGTRGKARKVLTEKLAAYEQQLSQAA